MDLAAWPIRIAAVRILAAAQLTMVIVTDSVVALLIHHALATLATVHIAVGCCRSTVAVTSTLTAASAHFIADRTCATATAVVDTAHAGTAIGVTERLVFFRAVAIVGARGLTGMLARIARLTGSAIRTFCTNLAFTSDAKGSGGSTISITSALDASHGGITVDGTDAPIHTAATRAKAVVIATRHKAKGRKQRNPGK